mgnify:CR=1 FL=1|jgi:hypothetical protein
MNIKKNILNLLLLFISVTVVAQEKINPSFDIKFEREVSSININNKEYTNVIIEIDADSYSVSSSNSSYSLNGDYSSSNYNERVDYDGVKITIKDKNSNEIIYKERFPKSFLYGLPDGTIRIGKDYVLTQLKIFKKDEKWTAVLKEKGIY